MWSPEIKQFISILAFISKISAHGIVQGIVVDGVYQPNFYPGLTEYEDPIPVRPGWSIPEDQDLGFISDFTSPDIICHVGATPGGSYVTVAAGDKMELDWTVWPDDHHGPMIDYLASCNGDCTTVDKTSLLFNKIDEAGLVDGLPAPGTWASDTLIANNNSWPVTIPSGIAPGRYVLRHEVIALHSAENEGGAQAYPQCFNLEITGSGTDSLTGGTLGTSLYTSTDPGILVNIWWPGLTNYTIPGPALISVTGSGTQGSSSSFDSASTAAKAASSPAAVYAASSASMSSLSTATSSTSSFVTAAHSAAWGDWSYKNHAVAAISNSVSSTDTFPQSFTSTFTGRVGKPTKYTCYVNDE